MIPLIFGPDLIRMTKRERRLHWAKLGERRREEADRQRKRREAVEKKEADRRTASWERMKADIARRYDR